MDAGVVVLDGGRVVGDGGEAGLEFGLAGGDYCCGEDPGGEQVEGCEEGGEEGHWVVVVVMLGVCYGGVGRIEEDAIARFSLILISLWGQCG